MAGVANFVTFRYDDSRGDHTAKITEFCAPAAGWSAIDTDCQVNVQFRALVEADLSGRGSQLANFEIVTGSHGRFLAYSPDLITDKIRQFGAHTRPEIAFLVSAVQPGDRIIDAGAHIGTFAVPLAKAAGSTGRVLAVEAHDLTCSALKINISLNQLADRIICVNAAIGPKGETRGPMVMTPGNTGAAAFKPGGTGVRFQPLSEIMRDHDMLSPDVIKMDVEGMEFYIFFDL